MRNTSLLLKLIVTCWSIAICIVAGAQNHNIDSLKAAAANKENGDTLRINALVKLSGSVYLLSNADSADFYAVLLYDLAEGMDYKGAMAEALRFRAIGQDIQGNFVASIALHKQSIELRQEVDDQEGLARSYGNLGLAYRHAGMYAEAVDCITKGLNINKVLDHKTGIASSLNNLGLIYMDQAEYNTNPLSRKEDYAHAARYFAESAKLKGELGDRRGEANSLNNLAIVYRGLNRNEESLDILKELLARAEEIGDTESIGNLNNNIGVVYNFLAHSNLDNKSGLELRQKAINHFETGRLMRAENGDTLGLINSLNNLGITYAEMGNHEKSIALNAHALKMALNRNSLADIRNISESLYKSQKEVGDYKNALEMYGLYISTRDSINNQDARENLLKHELETTYEKQKLEENLRYESNLQKQKNLRNLSFAGGAILLLLVFIIFNRFRLKQKAAKALEAKNAEVEAARERAERSEAFRSQFLANMSHEIRTPMNAILGITRLLMDRKHDAQSHTYLNAVDHAAKNLLVVINDVLDLSKLEAGKMEASIHPTHLTAELEMLSTTFSLRAGEKGLRFELSIKSGLPEYVLTDIARVNQILYNLLGNAVKFTNAGTVQLEVSHQQITTDQVKITFAVSDSGIGIPEEKQTEIFESFGQGHTHESRQYGGTGLGLTIARSLAELLGGSLTLQSTLGVGSTFTFFIECHLSSEAQMDAYRNKRNLILTDRHRSYPISILLADDNEYNRMVATDTLKKYFPNAEIDSTESGTQVLEMLPKKPYDLVLMDVQMPGMDGYDCTHAIRSLPDENLRNVHIVAFTASVIRTDIQKCYDAGMNGYIPKPFHDEDLIEPIATLIDKYPDREARNNIATHRESNSADALFLKLVPKRLEKVKTALAEGDVTTVKKTIHLMRPQLIDAGMAEHKELFEWFEYFDAADPPLEWKLKSEIFCNLVSDRINSLKEQ